MGAGGPRSPPALGGCALALTAANETEAEQPEAAEAAAESPKDLTADGLHEQCLEDARLLIKRMKATAGLPKPLINLTTEQVACLFKGDATSSALDEPSRKKTLQFDKLLTGQRQNA